MKRYFILYDLETSSKNFIGQILTGYFFLVDQEFQPVPGFELDLKVKISKLELPHPDAILVNRIDVVLHQKNAIEEMEACGQVVNFIARCLEHAGEKKVKLLGYNSSNFDLPFLRTTLIRNGFNPYFMGKILYGDGLHIVRKIAWEHSNFPLTVEETKEGRKYYSFSLENTCRSFHLLDGEQPHSAKEDVELLRALLEILQKTFAKNLWDYPVFNNPLPFFTAYVPPRPKDEKEESSTIPLYDQEHYYLLDHQKNSYLFVNLKQFLSGQGRDSIYYKNQTTGYLYLAPSFTMEHDDFTELEKAIDHQFQGISCDTFFPLSDCDIEQDIYRLSFDELRILRAKIEHRDTKTDTSQDFRQLWRRYVLKYSQPGQPGVKTNDFQKAFTQYVQMRYIRGVKTNKVGAPNHFSETWDELNTDLQEKLISPKRGDLTLLRSLEKFYKRSPVRVIVEQLKHPQH